MTSFVIRYNQVIYICKTKLKNREIENSRKENGLIQLFFLTKLRSISSGTLLDELQRALAAL